MSGDSRVCLDLDKKSVVEALERGPVSPDEEQKLRGFLQSCVVVELRSIAARFGLSRSTVGTKKADIVNNLLELSRSRGLRARPANCNDGHNIRENRFSLDGNNCGLSLSLREWLERGSQNTKDVRAALQSELENLTVDRLKSLAKELGARLTGAGKKGEVVERLLALSSIGSLGCESSNRSSEASLTYVTEEVKKELSKLPVLDKIESWTKSLTAVKQFHFVNLYVYLVESRDKTFDQQSMRAFKSLKAYKYYADGFVQNMWLCKVCDSDLVVVRAFCYHSLTADSALRVFVVLSGSKGDVYLAQCNCVAGLGASCSHIAAILFALEDAVKNKLTELPSQASMPSKTSLPMQWNRPPKKVVQPAPVHNIAFMKAAYGKKPRETETTPSLKIFDPRAPQDRVIDERMKHTLLATLANVFPESGAIQFWRDGSQSAVVELDSEKVQKAVYDLVLFSEDRAKAFDILSPEPVAPTLSECEELLSAMAISNALAAEIEELTRAQTSSKLWRDLHNGRLTSSKFGEILHRCDSSSSNRIVGDIMGYRRHVETAATRWGKNNESHARTQYLKEKAAMGFPVRFEESGLHLYPTASYLGASSDGLLSDNSVDSVPSGCLEIKCPFGHHGKSLLHLTPEEIAADFKGFCLEKQADGSVHLKQNHNYYAQVQGEMSIIGVEWCDFVVYTPKGIFIERIVRDGQYWEEILLPCLTMFYRRHVLPELCTAAIYRRLQVPATDPHSKEATTAPVSIHMLQTKSLAIVQHFLAYEKCQARLNGRNGSNACTIIAATVCESLLMQNFLPPLSSSAELPTETEEGFVKCMEQGNALYDVSKCEGLLSVDEALLVMRGKTQLQLRKELFTNCDAKWSELVKSLLDYARPLSTAILVQTPISVALAAMDGGVTLFDSHAHGNKGALIAVMPPEAAVGFLKRFFNDKMAYCGLLECM